ncbi:MAG: radical SAM protein [Candidatus Pacearchaeota archaeon]
MFDPVELAKATEAFACKNSLRKYYRFRAAAFYGGIATADCVGCNLRCVYCWAYNVVKNAGKIGYFYSPKKVAEKLLSIASRKNFYRIRISGNEPTLSKEHLLQVLELIPERYSFILETNGIMIGYDKEYARQLAAFPNLHVRVSLKGTTPEEFSKLTGAKPEGFELQLKALEYLTKEKVSCHAALIEIANQDVAGLKRKLAKIDHSLEEIEIEPLILYPAVKQRLEKLTNKI